MLPAVVHALHVACNPCCLVEICGFHHSVCSTLLGSFHQNLNLNLLLFIYIMFYTSHSLVSACSRRSDSGVQRKIREKEKIRSWRRRRRGREEKRVPSLSPPTPPPCCIFLVTSLCANLTI